MGKELDDPQGQKCATTKSDSIFTYYFFCIDLKVCIVSLLVKDKSFFDLVLYWRVS